MPRQARARATVAALIEAMALVVKERGLEAATTNHVAERAGVNIGSLYQYFPSKAALLDALVGDRIARYEAALVDAFARADALPLEAGVAEILRRHIEALAHEPEVHAVAVPYLRAGEGDPRYVALKGRIVARLAAYLRARPAEAGPAASELESAARTAVDCVEAVTLASLATSGGALPDDPSVQQLPRLAQRYLGR